MNKYSQKNVRILDVTVNAAWIRRIIVYQDLKKIVLLTLFSTIFIVGTGCDPGSPETQPSLDTFTANLDRRIPRLMDRYDIPGVSIALIRNGKTAWSSAYGYADIEHGRQMTPDAICRVESISKSVTAWGVLRLVEQGLVDPDAPVQQYLGNWKLPDSDYPEEKVTVRRLLSHTSGMSLGTIGNEYPPHSRMPNLKEYLTGEVHFSRKPGSGFNYSNTGYNLLELVIEEVTGRDFQEYMKNEVLMPLGMHNSGFTWNDTVYAEIPNGYDLHGTPVAPYVYPAKASGGLFAPAGDIARFVSAGMTGDFYTDHGILSQDKIRLLYTPEVEIPGMFGIVADSYGFGHFTESLAGGRKAVWHGGQGHGWMSHFHSVPGTGNGIVILTNSQRSWPLMASILKDWSRFCGFGNVKMSRITHGIIALRILICMVTLLSLWQVYSLIRDLRNGNRKPVPRSKHSRGIRLLMALSGSGIIAALIWSVTRPYLFVSSVFPVTAGWAAGASLFLAIVLIMTAWFPKTKNYKRNQNESDTIRPVF